LTGPLAARGNWLFTARGTPHRPDVEEVGMLEGRTRIPPVDVETLPDDLRDTLEEQRKLRGAPLYPYLFYARNAAYFRAAKAMWAALQEETKRVPVTLRAMINRRVAAWNGCEF
jgi:alkylhydroperoxidase family enzyme